MDRKAKIDKIANQDGKVSKISNLSAQPKYLNPDYKLDSCNGILGETGKLEVLRVVPKSGSGPYFVARWDQVPEHLDIDMHGASRSAIRKFKKNKDGYGGHHSTRTTDPNTRVFEVIIHLPDNVIFDGEVSFSNTYEAKVTMQIQSNVTLATQVIRVNPQDRGY